MTWRRRYLTQFPQHNIADLISGITFIVLFQSGEASTVKGNKHTDTHTQKSNKSGKLKEWREVKMIENKHICKNLVLHI